jgi:hypothetical protein
VRCSIRAATRARQRRHWHRGCRRGVLRPGVTTADVTLAFTMLPGDDVQNRIASGGWPISCADSSSIDVGSGPPDVGHVGQRLGAVRSPSEVAPFDCHGRLEVDRCTLHNHAHHVVHGCGRRPAEPPPLLRDHERQARHRESVRTVNRLAGCVQRSPPRPGVGMRRFLVHQVPPPASPGRTKNRRPPGSGRVGSGRRRLALSRGGR